MTTLETLNFLCEVVRVQANFHFPFVLVLHGKAVLIMGLLAVLTINLSILRYLKETAFGGSFLCLNLYVNKDRKMKCIFWAERENIRCDPFCMINFRMIFVSAPCCHYLTVTKKNHFLWSRLVVMCITLELIEKQYLKKNESAFQNLKEKNMEAVFCVCSFSE